MTIDARPAEPSRPRDVSAHTELIVGSGEAVMTDTAAHAAMTVAK